VGVNEATDLAKPEATPPSDLSVNRELGEVPILY